MPPTADTITVKISQPPHQLHRPQTLCTELTVKGNELRERTKMKMKMQSQDLVGNVHGDKYDFFYKEPCLYSHKVYVKGAKVFEFLKHSTSETDSNNSSPYLRSQKSQQTLSDTVQDLHVPQLSFEDNLEKRLTFELAFTALKFQVLFEEVLDDCAFFVTYPEHVEDLGLVMVVLCDYQSRKFQPRTPLEDEVLDSVATEVEDAICECKTKLNAAFARRRIKASVPSLSHLLPDTVRNKEAIGTNIPVYAWVNQVKTSISEVIDQFKDEGFTLVNSDEKLTEKQFAVDPLCTDVLIFPGEYREDLVEHDLFIGGKIVIQDKSSCIAPHSIKHLLGDDSDIIHVNVGSGHTTAHIASLMHNSNSRMFAFGAKSTAEAKTIQGQFEQYGIKGIKVPTESFESIDPGDSKYKNVRVILVTANCSRSGVTNPVDFIVNEGEDMKILKDMSKGDVDFGRITELSTKQMNTMKHAMSFSKVQAVVYMTRSIHEAENENVVLKSIEYSNMIQQKKFPWKVVPPVLPFSGDEIENNVGIVGKYIKFHPTEKSSGCFVAVVTREPEDAKEAARDVLARAQAKGLLHHKKSKHNILENGEVHDTQSDNKLLYKRGKKAQRKVKKAFSLSQATPYTLPSIVSPIGTYIHADLKSQRQSASTKSTTSAASKESRLYQFQTKTFMDQKNKDKHQPVSEHKKVVNHPAPFR